ncbi:MAG TPA: sigma-70 family RNA polymerase sigma factor [Steroidobacteraceae bacterium]|jgi:RNA polymerase sigma-70 factor (ECF subfamily)|nr:sigma-70 family RNA polymerase sigma factor [Steroidobacteraceae bacterium]
MNSVSSSGHSLSTSGGSSSNARELELLRQVATGDRTAFKELYLIYHRRLARFLMRMTSRHDLIEEVINDTLWTVWLKAGDFRGDSLVSTWIVGITYRRALKALRRHGAPRPMLVEEVAVAPDAQQEDENRQWLGQALAELPLEQRMVMEFSYLMGHSCEEIAQIMQCPVNTVKTRMFHAREKLRRSLPRLAGSNQTGGNK